VRTTVKETGSEHARVCTFAIKEEGAGGSTFNLTLRPRSRSGEGDFEIVVPNVPPPEVAIELWRSAAPTDVRLVDLPASASEPKLHDLYSRAKEQARADVAIESLREIIPGFQNIEILTDQGQPVLHVNYDTHTVPAATAGDGVRLLLRTCLELSGRPGGSVLIEEPELHLHPAAIYQTALAIHAAVRRDVQVVLSTHSLELIDALVATAGDDAQIAKMSLYRLGLDAGVLKSSRTPGPDIAFARTTVEDDLR
jgi:hypothetical protein